MISPRLLFILSAMILPQLLFSQQSHLINPIAFNHGLYSDLKLPLTSRKIDNSLKYNHIFSDVLKDTMSVKTPGLNAVQINSVSPRWIRGAIIPAALILTGTITLLPESHCLLSKYTIQDKVLNLFPDAGSSIDDYLQYAPLALSFGLKAAGVKSRSDFVNQIAITAKTELLMNVIVKGMKIWIPSERPTDNMHSMPSGHTAQAFVSATILDMEYRETSTWISIGGYAVATTTAMYRMINNKHWISDVLIGAGIGIFSTKVVYFTHRYRWGNKSNIVILPAIYKDGGGVSFAMVL